MNTPNVLLATSRPMVYALFSYIRDIDHKYFEIIPVPSGSELLDSYGGYLTGASLFAVDVVPDPIAATQLSQLVHAYRECLPILAITCCPQCLTWWNLQALVAAGVSNVFDFHAGADELAGLLHRIVNGDMVVHLELGYGLQPFGAEALHHASLIESFSSFRSLTEAEIQILQLLSQGRSDREIGQGVHLSGHTVKHHIERLRGLAGARNRIELAAWAGRRGFSCLSPSSMAPGLEGPRE